MKWIEAKVTFTPDLSETTEDLIANIFDELGIKGVIIEQPNWDKEVDWADHDIHQPNLNSVTGFFPNSEQAIQLKDALNYRLEQLKREHPFTFQLEYKIIDEANWAESWKSYFFPQKISKFIVVKPTWCDYTQQPNDIVVEIDPGMAFGTGTHATTMLCVQMIEKYVKAGDRLLDIGTGSGILMIAAAKLGAAQVHGVDIDPMAITIAENNLVLNKIPKDCFYLWVGDMIRPISMQYDIVVANILHEPILILLKSIKTVLCKNAIVIVSGIIQDKKELILNEMKHQHLDIIDLCEEQEWVAISARFGI
ncbi:MAG: 50S ribosomal protein L11 methyltransferase [Desulfobacterales bacterium]|nr:50S ribosomal protein L11 methyltransferase [Desulfobacterales bacterium]